MENEIYIGKIVWYWAPCSCGKDENFGLDCRLQCLNPRAAVIHRVWDPSGDPCLLAILPSKEEIDSYMVEAQKAREGLVNNGRCGMWSEIGDSAPIGNRPEDLSWLP